jgi:RNA polymerase sigma-54 factor
MGMSIGINQVMKQSQQQILAPRMIQSMEILQLPIMALQEKIQQELQENPVLELKEVGAEDQPAGEAGDQAAVDEPAAEPAESADPGDKELVIDGEQGEEDFDRLDALNRDWEDHFNEEHRPSRNSLEEEADKKHDAMQNMASRPQSLQDYLSDQLLFFDIPPEELRLIRYLIGYIDNNGYLKLSDDDPERHSSEPLSVILARRYDLPVDAQDVEDAIHQIQKLDPRGVGARDLAECLLLQLTPETPHHDVVRVLIQHHLEDIQHNRLPIIQKKTGYDLNLIKDGIDALRHLNPKPGAEFTEDSTPYVVPDIVVERTEEGDYTVRLLDDWVPKIYISKRYQELYKDKSADKEARKYLKERIQAAQWLLDAIQQRRNTLEKVAKAIVQHQRAFLDRGPEHIEPLKMQQIADLVGVHVTTVSRAVDDKWVQTPRGIFPLKRFFGGGKETAEGEVAYEAIKQKLREIIDHEDKSNPLSDEELVQKLNEAGYPVARRTVTKYRKMHNIPSSRQRKDWTA